MSREGGGMYCYGDERFPVDKQPHDNWVIKEESCATGQGEGF